jgi:predicted HicB family RNase H-like nuclease
MSSPVSRQLNVRVSNEQWRQLRLLAAERETSLRFLVIEAIDLLLREERGGD